MANQTKKHLKLHGTKRNGGKMAEKGDNSKHVKCAPKIHLSNFSKMKA